MRGKAPGSEMDSPLAESIFGYANETTIVVGRLDTPDGESPDEVLAVTLEGRVRDVEIIDMVRLGFEPPPPMTIDRRQSIYEWGASGASLEFLVWVSQTVATGTLAAGIEALISRHGRRTDPLERDPALHTAKQTILLANPGITAGMLELKAETEDREDGAFVFVLAGAGFEFTADVRSRRGLANVTTLSKRCL